MRMVTVVLTYSDISAGALDVYIGYAYIVLYLTSFSPHPELSLGSYNISIKKAIKEASRDGRAKTQTRIAS